MMIQCVTLIAIFIVILVSFIRHVIIRKQHPPGPLGFPFVGHAPILLGQMLLSRFLPKTSQAKYFRQIKEKYGDIWSIDLGNRLLIGLASVDVLHEAFVDNGKVFSGRTKHVGFKIISEERGIALTDGELWHNNRQLAIKALRDLGMGKQLLESKVSNEVDELICNIENNLSTPIKSPEIFGKAVSNVICQLAFDVRHKYTDPDFEGFIKDFNIIGHSNEALDMLSLYSKVLSIKHMRTIFTSVDKFVRSNLDIMKFIGKKCRSRIKIEGEYSKPSCVFDYFWRYRYQDEPDIDPEEIFLNISHSMLDLFIAGTDTTTNMLAYFCLMLGLHTGVQQELRTEIQSLVDDYKLITMDMRKDCPKLLSFIDEVSRYCYLVPISPRRVMETCKFRGYKIQCSDIVYGDLATSMYDDNIFKNPSKFNPSRFMDESRSKYVPNKSLLQFGVGKRACLGESIAVMELFLFLSKIILRFKISLSSKTKNRISEILEGGYGFAHVPLDHEVIFELLH